MAEASSYVFSHQEVVAQLIRAAGIHEGKWSLQINFGFTAGNFQTGDGAADPGALVAIQKLGIVRAEAGSLPNMTVDAAEVNPRK